MRRYLAPVVVAAAVAVGLGLTGPGGPGPISAAAGAEPTVHFTAAADHHFTAGGVSTVDAHATAVFAKIAQLQPDLSIVPGDLSYGAPGSEQAWCDAVTSILGAGFPFELVAGNHDADGSNGNINDFSSCMPNQLPGAVGTYGRQWYVDVPAQAPLVRFVMISPNLTFPDSTWEYTAGSPRYAWTAAAIDGARTKSIPWVVVGMHKPCLSTGVYGCESGPDLLNLLVAKKVDLVLQGHQHVYERTKQLALAPGCPAIVPGAADPDCIADADSDLVKGAGTVFDTISTGGAAQRELNPADPEAPYFAATSGIATATWGALDVTATATRLTASFARAAGGSFTDAFSIGSADPQSILASDTFDRTVSSGFGSADVGGAWTTTSGATSVSSGTGRLTLASQSSLAQARLTAVTGTALTTRVTESWDKRPSGSGGWFLLRGRVTTGGEYRLKVAHKSTGAVAARLVRTNAAGTETAITSELTVPGLTYTAGTAITTLFEVSGTSPTTLRAKVWAATGTQPSAWLISTTDATTALQTTGHTGLAALVSSTTTNGPVTVRVDNYTVTGP